MDQRISVLSNENIKQLRRFKEVLEKHSYKPDPLKDIDTSISWLPSTLYKLKEDTPQNRQGQHSIRINDQWRICFVWKDGEAWDIEIADYH
jgi:plasmid maintenance system killer protein